MEQTQKVLTMEVMEAFSDAKYWMILSSVSDASMSRYQFEYRETRNDCKDSVPPLRFWCFWVVRPRRAHGSFIAMVQRMKPGGIELFQMARCIIEHLMSVFLRHPRRTLSKSLRIGKKYLCLSLGHNTRIIFRFYRHCTSVHVSHRCEYYKY